MPKRRTKKHKRENRASANIARLYEDAGDSAIPVKREFTFEPGMVKLKAKKQKKTTLSAKQISSKSLKREIVKSLFLASLILSLELVLYLVWK